jgi:hypothetical protein
LASSQPTPMTMPMTPKPVREATASP